MRMGRIETKPRKPDVRSSTHSCHTWSKVMYLATKPLVIHLVDRCLDDVHTNFMRDMVEVAQQRILRHVEALMAGLTIGHGEGVSMELGEENRYQERPKIASYSWCQVETRSRCSCVPEGGRGKLHLRKRKFNCSRRHGTCCRIQGNATNSRFQMCDKSRAWNTIR